jgi:hypothetical protein
MLSFIKDIMLRVTGVRAVLVKVIDSAQSAIRVLELIQNELKTLGIPESSAIAIDLIQDWLTVIVTIMNKVLSIKIGDQPVFGASSTTTESAIDELKKKLEELKSIV